MQRFGVFGETVDFIRKLYDPQNSQKPIQLHEPKISNKEKEFVNKCIDSTFISSVGEYVNLFENQIAEFTGARYAIATVNGTSALHIALLLMGVKPGDEVITQDLTFIATANAIRYCDAAPILVDSAKNNLGICPDKLEEFLYTATSTNDKGECINLKTKKVIRACVPMHVFGHAVDIKRIKSICDKYNLKLIEDAAEALGSLSEGRHVGTTGDLAILSFNGNKVITCGGGGMLITNNRDLANRAKHITTTSRLKHGWEFIHDEIGYNYRLPNINAAFACAQMESLKYFIENKRETAELYKNFFMQFDVPFLLEPTNCRSNYWLNAIFLKDREEREKFLEYTNTRGVGTRPLWRLMHKLDMFKNCQQTNLDQAIWYEDRVVNIPSSVRKL